MLWERVPGWRSTCGLLGLCSLVLFAGCRDDSLEDLTWEDIDRPTAGKHLTVFTKAGPVEVRERATLALTRLNDDIVESQPIMIRALLTEDENGLSLQVTFWDEDRDIRGIRLREQRHQANGQTVIIEEEYPAFIFDLRPATCGTYTLTSIIGRERTNDRKDESAWLRYENDALNQLVEACAHVEDISDLSLIMVESPSPPILMSIPEPDKVRVELAVYDRQGNVSDYAEVLFRSVSSTCE